jgi:hypothetical protein
MAKGPIVTPEIEAFIASIYQKHPKWKALEVRNEVSFLLRKSDPKLPASWPSLSTVQKILATIRKSMKETPMYPEDKPWSMGTLNEYPIPPDVLPSVLKVWKSNDDMVHKFGMDKLAFDPTLTIRQAKWAGRLAHIIDDIRVLANFAIFYATTERIYQYLGKPFDSHILDYELMSTDKKIILPHQEAFKDYFKGLIKELSEKQKERRGKANER